MSQSNVVQLDELYLGQVADKLGEARARLKLVQDEVKALEAELKQSGQTEVCGDWYRVKVSCYEQAKVNWKKVAEKLEPSHQLVSAHTSHQEVCKLTVSAHKKGADYGSGNV